MSQLRDGNEQSVIEQIEKALKEKGEQKLNALMEISLIKERQAQQKKDGQVLAILRGKDEEIKALKEGRDTDKAKIEKLETDLANI